MVDRSDKPPLGVMPEWRWRELRIRDLVLAATRYAKADRLATPEDQTMVMGWTEEANQHLQWLMECEDWSTPQGLIDRVEAIVRPKQKGLEG